MVTEEVRGVRRQLGFGKSLGGRGKNKVDVCLMCGELGGQQLRSQG